MNHFGCTGGNLSYPLKGLKFGKSLESSLKNPSRAPFWFGDVTHDQSDQPLVQGTYVERLV